MSNKSNWDWRKCTICADSKVIIKKIPNNSIDFILTDPPYNIGQHSTGNIPLEGRTAMNNDVAAWDLVDFNPEEWAEEFIRILKPTGNLFIFTSYNQIGRWYKCLDHRFDTTNFMIWHKTNPAPKIFKAGFLNSCEMIFTCWNKKHTWNFISQKEMHNFIESSVCMRPERISNPKHPAQKPISILEKMIEIASNPDDIVFDPFMGVGSTGVAALRLGRKFIGVEIDREYYNAACKRIEKELETPFNNNNAFVGETATGNISTRLCDIWNIIECEENNNNHAKHENGDNNKNDVDDGETLPPILKWPGGKGKELPVILNNIPKNFVDYYEPFVGGGAVFTAIKAERYYINDMSDELVAFYRSIFKNDDKFYKYAESIVSSWEEANRFFKSNKQLTETYLLYRQEIISVSELKTRINVFCKDRKNLISNIAGKYFQEHIDILADEMQNNLARKMVRMKKLEMEKHELPEKDIEDNIETAIKSALYMYFRFYYNNVDLIKNNPQLYSALFLFIRNYCYSGMFRYNEDGKFNVPYGGISYNSKSLKGKLKYYRSIELHRHFEKAEIENLDFEEFLSIHTPGKKDFMFLDPPYDSEFNTYSQNEFTRADQERLAHLLIYRCQCKWMMIIKHTDFIYNLYNNKKNISIRTFDKKYQVSFMDRNDRNAKHLLITNY